MYRQRSGCQIAFQSQVLAVGERTGRLVVKRDRVRMWRFTDAPNTLQSLHRTPGTPEWLVFVPRALRGTDLDDVILHPSEPGQVARYETPKGDIVYVGSTRFSGLSETPRPSAMAATHSPRK